MSEAKPKKKKPWVQDAAIYSALRRAYRSSPAVAECLNSGKEEFFILSKKGKKLRRVRFACHLCGTKEPKRTKKSKGGIAVDHIQPVVDPLDGNLLPDGTRDWNKQIRRLFVSVTGLQRLCKACHDAKSKQENAIRRKIKKEKKANEQ